MRKQLAAIAALLLLSSALCWFALSPQIEIVFARNLLLYRGENVWRAVAPMQTSGASGQLAGTVRDEHGEPLASATVLAADANGQIFRTESDSVGRFLLMLPRGVYLPMATRDGYEDATLQFVGGLKRTVNIQPGYTEMADLSMRRALTRSQAADDSLQFFDEAMAHTDIPQAANVRRRGLSFIRAGMVLTGSYVYEPLTEGRYPMLLFIYPCWVYPCSTLGWDLVSATMTAKGFVVVTFSPQRGTALEADMDDILKLIAHIKANQLSAKGESKLGLLGGSLTSIHVWRVAQLSRSGAVQAIVTLGGISDLFLIRQRFESHALLLEPPFDVPLANALIGLGRPNLEPQLYLRYSPVYHLDALPRVPIALIHGGGDKTVPYEQTPHFSERLKAYGVVHEMYLYPRQEHYLELSPPNADELDMLDKVVGFLQRALK